MFRRSGRRHLDVRQFHLSQFADRDEANKYSRFSHRRVAESASRRFRHEPLAGVGLLRRNLLLSES